MNKITFWEVVDDLDIWARKTGRVLTRIYASTTARVQEADGRIFSLRPGKDDDHMLVHFVTKAGMHVCVQAPHKAWGVIAAMKWMQEN